MRRPAPHISSPRRVARKNLVAFTRQLASMTAAGMPILETMTALREQCEDPQFAKVLGHVGDVIKGGEPLSTGLAAFPALFDNMYVNMVAAGEKSGQLEHILKRLCTILVAGDDLRRKIKGALTYPIVVISLVLVIAFCLIQFVVPIFAKMFSDFGKELPGLTQFFVNISDFIANNWMILVPSVVVAIIALVKFKRTDRGDRFFANLFLRLPVFGELMQKSAMARFGRLLAQMLRAGLPILQALDIVADALGNRILRDSIAAARKDVELGRQLCVGLENRPYVPKLLVRMVAAGERAGKLDEMLDSIADTYEAETSAMVAMLTALMEPFIMVFMGATIGTIVIAMFLPIFEMGSVVQ